jgi:hypothetical protein
MTTLPTICQDPTLHTYDEKYVEFGHDENYVDENCVELGKDNIMICRGGS